jgi:hypothetical protein
LTTLRALYSAHSSLFPSIFFSQTTRFWNIENFGKSKSEQTINYDNSLRMPVAIQETIGGIAGGAGCGPISR